MGSIDTLSSRTSFGASLRPATATQTDAELIQACLAHDETAWKELVERYGRLVYSIPLRYGLSANDADEVFQNVFSIVLRQLGTLRNPTALSAWLIAVTGNEAVRLRRAHRPHLELEMSLDDGSQSLPEQVQQWERQHEVHHALEQLDPRCRDLLKALFLEATPVSYRQVAEQFGMPEGSVGPTRARCFKKLEEILLVMGIDGYV